MVNHTIDLHCADDLVIESKAGLINQFMINLIMNSIIHGFKNVNKGPIAITIKVVDDAKVSIEFKGQRQKYIEKFAKAYF